MHILRCTCKLQFSGLIKGWSSLSIERDDDEKAIVNAVKYASIQNFSRTATSYVHYEYKHDGQKCDEEKYGYTKGATIYESHPRITLKSAVAISRFNG